MTLALAMILDALLGEPAWLWRRLPHPVVLAGRLIAALDTRFNRGRRRRLAGALVVTGLCLVAGALGRLIGCLPGGGLFEALAAAVLLAQRSLADHVGAVAAALRRSLPLGRQAVGRIVGRDTGAMRPSDVARAAIESAAENLADGVIAPAFWFLVAGLPGLMICKMVNTADSMIGHLTPRHREFGWAAARLDDVLNLIPARLTALLLALSHGWLDPRPILRYARGQPSPNAGWPEAAMAVSLNVALSGPRRYHEHEGHYPWIWPEGRRDPGPDEIEAAVRALWRAWGLMLALVLLFAAL